MRSSCKPSSAVLSKVTLSVWSNMLPSPSWFMDKVQVESRAGSPLRYQSQGGMTKLENVHLSIHKFYKQFCQLLQKKRLLCSAGILTRSHGKCLHSKVCWLWDSPPGFPFSQGLQFYGTCHTKMLYLMLCMFCLILWLFKTKWLIQHQWLSHSWKQKT